MDFSSLKFDIVVIAGQSNAEGNGKSLDKKPFVVEGVYEAIDANPYNLILDDKGGYHGLNLVMPPKIKIQELQERKSGEDFYCDMSISFAKEYVKSPLNKPDRKLIFLKAAFGGTGFALKQQGVGNVLYERLVEMTKELLNLNKENRIICLLWHQGEHDAFENANLNDKERYDFYFSEFKNQISSYRNEFSSFNIPVIAGSFCDEWKTLYLGQCLAVENATKDALKELGNGSFVNLSGLTSNNQEIHNGDNIHFSKKSQLIIGKKYFAEFLKLYKSE